MYWLMFGSISVYGINVLVCDVLIFKVVEIEY